MHQLLTAQLDMYLTLTQTNNTNGKMNNGQAHTKEFTIRGIGD